MLLKKMKEDLAKEKALLGDRSKKPEDTRGLINAEGLAGYPHAEGVSNKEEKACSLDIYVIANLDNGQPHNRPTQVGFRQVQEIYNQRCEIFREVLRLVNSKMYEEVGAKIVKNSADLEAYKKNLFSVQPSVVTIR